MKRSGPTLLAIGLVSLLVPTHAAAKVTCAVQLDTKKRMLTGMPDSPQPGATYETSIRTKTRYPANPHPILMLVRCEGEEDRQFMQVKPDREGAVRSQFSIEFKHRGHWVGALMDRGGRFFNIGPWDVGAPAPQMQTAALIAGLKLALRAATTAFI